ncbi:baseplate J/gp47 family protein [Sutterella wadsworthensis]|uniref:baseplate J/gp47 family protein n=1 Tax=Sutterella wadsworthensis TaxID=40545 RepID=UPI003AF10978
MPISDPVFQVTAQGITAPSYAEILEYLQEQARQIFGSDINLAADTQDGQLIAIVAAAISDVNAQAIAVYNSFNPNTAVGVALDSAVKTNGLQRREPTKSTVDLLLVGQAGTVITNGVAIDTFENRWLLPASVVIPTLGQITVTATAEEAGDIAAPAGSITTIGTPTLGWQSVTNTSAATIGVPVETDAELRARQARSTAIASVSLWEGIIGALLDLPGVTRVSGVKNDTDTPTPNGIPGHSIAMIVEGGDAQTIGETIFLKKGEGVGTFGDVSITYLDTYGFPNAVYFSRPDVVQIYCTITITPGAGYLSTVADEIQQRVADYVNSLDIGVSVNIGRVLASAIKDCATGVDTRFDVTGITLGTSSGGQTAASVQIAWDQAAQCSAANVSVELADD